MAITARTATYATTGSGTSLAVAEPTGAAQDDILFLWVDYANNNLNLSSGPTGWTLLNEWTSEPFNGAALYWIRRGSSALTAGERTVTFTGSASYIELEMLAFSGALTTGNPWDDAQYAAHTSGTAPDPPSATSSGADRMAVAFGLSWAGWGSGGATAPTNYTLTRTSSAGEGLASAYRAIGSGAENPGTFGNSSASDSIAAATIILAPASGIVIPVLVHHYKTQGIQ